MNIDQLFKLLVPNFENVVVSGCQRSGTTIASKMIAHSAGYEYVTEERFGVRSLEAYQALFEGGKRGQVIHAPGLSYALDATPNLDTTLFVWLDRDKDEVVSSMERIGWVGAKDELQLGKWWTASSASEFEGVYQMKQRQKLHFIKKTNMIVWPIHYRRLAEHPLWVPDEKRGGWKERQTS